MSLSLNDAIVAIASKFDVARRWAYRRAFRRDAHGRFPREIEIVLADLRDFCRAQRTTFDLDPRVSALLEGRRSVMLRIMDNLDLDDGEVRKLVEVERE